MSPFDPTDFDGVVAEVGLQMTGELEKDLSNFGLPGVGVLWPWVVRDAEASLSAIALSGDEVETATAMSFYNGLIIGAAWARRQRR